MARTLTSGPRFDADPGWWRGLASARQLQGKELSFNNLVDLEASWRLVKEFDETYVGISTNCHFHVVITNNSKKSLKLLKEGSSWGWETLSLELTDETGKKYLIHRTPVAWTDNAPVYWILKPGEHYVRDVCLAQIYIRDKILGRVFQNN